jgi:hypothetical protein
MTFEVKVKNNFTGEDGCCKRCGNEVFEMVCSHEFKCMECGASHGINDIIFKQDDSFYFGDEDLMEALV